MNAAGPHLGVLREPTWSQVLLVVAVLVGCRLLVLLVRRIVRAAAESAPSQAVDPADRTHRQAADRDRRHRTPEPPGALKALLVPCPADHLVMWPVDRRLGNVKNNDPSLIEPVAIER